MLFLTSIFAKVAGKLGGGIFGFLNKRGERQTNQDVAGLESLRHSKKDEITLATFYLPIWMFLLGAILIAVGLEHRGRILVDTAKETIVFLESTLSLNSFYGWTLGLIVLVSLGLSRVAANIRRPKGNGGGGGNSSGSPAQGDVFKGETK